MSVYKRGAIGHVEVSIMVSSQLDVALRFNMWVIFCDEVQGCMIFLLRRLLGVPEWCEYGFGPSGGAYYWWLGHVGVCCYSLWAEVHLRACCDLSSVAQRLSQIGIYHICDVIFLNDVWGWLNDLCTTFVVVILWKGKDIYSVVYGQGYLLWIGWGAMGGRLFVMFGYVLGH